MNKRKSPQKEKAQIIRNFAVRNPSLKPKAISLALGINIKSVQNVIYYMRKLTKINPDHFVPVKLVIPSKPTSPKETVGQSDYPKIIDHLRDSLKAAISDIKSLETQLTMSNGIIKYLEAQIERTRSNPV